MVAAWWWAHWNWIPSLIRNSPFGHIYVYYTCETYFETFLVWPARRLILKIIFSFISNKKLRKWVWELKIIFYFLFLKIKNMMFSKNIFNFFVLFSLIFFRVVLKNNYQTSSLFLSLAVLGFLFYFFKIILV